MKKISRLCSILLLASSCFAQPVTSLTVENPPKVTIQRGQSAVVKLRAKITPGYHINSNKPHEEYLIPLRRSSIRRPMMRSTAFRKSR